MTATKRQQKPVRPERRIIERPRLIKQLDGTDARVILLIAPAGYGKTTLARQYAKTLSGAIWLSATATHRDVAAFAEEVAAGIDALGGNASRFIREYLRARTNPQRAARLVGDALAARMEEARVQWLILDDYHELDSAPEIGELVLRIHDRSSCRLLVAARQRPSWASARRSLYGEIAEIGRDELAMTDEETAEVVPGRADLASVVDHAQGWPAALALAAASKVPLGSALPPTLHRYLAQELFQSADTKLQADLMTMALLPELSDELLTGAFGDRSASILEAARDLGFLSGDEARDLHPLLREFLLAKVAEEPRGHARVRAAVETSAVAEKWEAALELVLRFNLFDLVAPVIEQAFKPLARAGRLGTLSSFAQRIRKTPTFPPATVDVVEAEVALRDGELALAAELAGRASGGLAPDHPLYSRIRTIEGHAAYFLGQFEEAEVAFADARVSAQDDADETEAIHGLAIARIFGEREGASEAVAALAKKRHTSPTVLARYTTADLSRRHFAEGLRAPLRLEEALHALPRIEDPRARTALLNTVAYSYAQRSEYDVALGWAHRLLEDVRAFALEFAVPYTNWTLAFINLGLRKFGVAERLLQAVEDAVAETEGNSHIVNARSLRARLLLETGKPAEALELVEPDFEIAMIPSWHAEYLATRALVYACLGRPRDATHAAKTAHSRSTAGLVQVLSAAAKAVASTEIADGERLMSIASTLAIWDPVVCALRASPALADAMAADRTARQLLASLYRRSRDYGLARRAGIRVPASRTPSELLSPRELEVLELMSQGMRNREIAAALFISESTTKVHVRHVLEKLGVRTRAEAVARFGRLQDAE